jgi:hypothetical protein
MKSLFGASLSITLAALFATSALAAELPEVKISAGNKVPQCVTPDRLTTYLKSRNPKLDARYEKLAALYKQHGEALHLRWDIAFFQMILETGALRYTGDVRPAQNNFAGLGASGGGNHGESFPDLSTGVKAHLQHLLMYAGEHIDDPVADRTRKVQEWGVLTSWQKSIEGPMTYTLVAKQWAPTSRNYVRDVSTITDGFYNAYCDGAGPAADTSQEASVEKPKAKKTKVTIASIDGTSSDDSSDTPPPAAKSTGADIAKRAVEEERKQGGALKGLGAGMIANVGTAGKANAEPAKQPESQSAEDSPPVTLLNAKQDTSPATSTTTTATAETKAPAAKADSKKAKPDAKVADKAAPPADKAPPAAETAKGANLQTASISSAATQMKVPAAAKSDKCKVFTASYGGQRAVIIKANGEGQTNYTVLDVTDANEKREVDAYIAAYAKGGEKVATFPSQNKALTKAFELCPEG